MLKGRLYSKEYLMLEGNSAGCEFLHVKEKLFWYESPHVKRMLL